MGSDKVKLLNLIDISNVKLQAMNFIQNVL